MRDRHEAKTPETGTREDDAREAAFATLQRLLLAHTRGHDHTGELAGGDVGRQHGRGALTCLHRVAGKYPTPIDGLMLVRQQCPCHTGTCLERPLATIFVQGEKRSLIGGREYAIHEGQCLVSAVEMHSVSTVLNVSPERPFLALFFYLDRNVLGELALKVPAPTGQDAEAGAGELLSIATAETDVVCTAARLLELLDKPQQIPVRGPMILKELHYLLLIGPQGHVLRRLCAQGTPNAQIMEAITLLKQHLSAPLRVEELARRVHMSVSSLHRHFKSLTGVSPLQFHKHLRLHEAQRLMLVENARAVAAAQAVGYESVTQFNREYKRLFGEPPHRDVSRRRTFMTPGPA